MSRAAKYNSFSALKIYISEAWKLLKDKFPEYQNENMALLFPVSNFENNHPLPMQKISY